MGPEHLVLHDEEVRVVAFGDGILLFAEEQGFLRVLFPRFLGGEDAAQKIQRGDVAAQPADILDEGGADAVFLPVRMDRDVADDDAQMRKVDFRRQVGAGRGAAGELEINDAVRDFRLLDQLVKDADQFRVGVRDRDRQFAHGAAVALQMFFQRKAFAVVNADCLKHAVAELKAAVLQVDCVGVQRQKSAVIVSKLFQFARPPIRFFYYRGIFHRTKGAERKNFL